MSNNVTVTHVNISQFQSPGGQTANAGNVEHVNRDSIAYAANYYPFDTTWKDVIAWCFTFKLFLFVLIDHILSEIISLFCFYALFSSIYPQIFFTTIYCFDPCTFYISNILI